MKATTLSSQKTIEYVEEPEEEQLYNDEVLDIEINEPLDEFTVSLSFVAEDNMAAWA